VLVTFWRTPAWARPEGSKPVTFPTDPQDYAAALKWAATRWAASVDGWEIWNEPNSSAFADPVNSTTYGTLVRAAYPAAKAGDPGSPVIAGSTMYVDLPYLKGMIDAAGMNSFDAISVHPYQGTANLPPDAPMTSSTQYRMVQTGDLVSLLAARGRPGLPIWFTEFGWSVHANTATTASWELGVTEDQAAQYLAGSLRLVRDRWPSVTNVFWYSGRDTAKGNLQSDHRGLMTRDFQPRAALLRVGCAVQGSC
jgi:hypothetical protein